MTWAPQRRAGPAAACICLDTYMQSVPQREARIASRARPRSKADIVVYTVHIHVYTVRYEQRPDLQCGENRS
jgi:hypothetical protein